MALDKLTIINNGGLSTTSDYRVGILTATKFIGPIESGSATFTGSVSIGGTLTYEDVTNIDSVGIITARDGIHVTSGRLGIGTDDPDEKLHVYNGAGNVTSFVEAIAGDALLNLSNSGNGNYSGINFIRERGSGQTGRNGGSIFMPSNTANNEAFLYIQAQSTSAHAGITGALSANNGVRLKLHGDDGIFSIETGDSERLRINSSGNARIGGTSDTTDQGYRLTLQGSSNATYLQFFDNGTGTTHGSDGSFVGLINQDFYVWNREAKDVVFGSSNNERLRLDSGGRVLINRTNNDAPGGSASKLQIRDTTYTASIAVVRNDPGGGGPSLVFGKSRNATQSDNTLVQNGDILGQISFFGADGSDMNSTGAMITAQVDGTPGSNDMPGRLVFKTTADGSASSTERLRITSGGDLIHTSNDKTLSLVSSRNQSQAGTKIAFFGADRYDTDEEFAAIKGLLVSNSGGSGKQNGSLQFIVGSASHTHTMSQGGFVGIGTGNPQALLHLQGEGGGNTSGLYFKNGPHDVVRQYFANGNDNSDFVISYDGTGGAEITLKHNGNLVLNESNGDDVGIGKATPQGKLHISSGASGDCELIIEADTDNNNENDNPRIVFQQDGGSQQAAIGQLNNELTLSNSVSSNGGIVFKTGTTSPYTNATERLRIHHNGKVGIGTNNPSQELTLYGTDPIFSVQEATVSSQVDIGTGTVTGFINIQKANGTRTIQLSGDGVSYFNAGTNFGIGTNNPQSILHIEHATPGIRLGDTGNSGAYAFFDANAANAIIHADKGNTVSDSRVAFAVDNAEKARITSNGLRVNTTVDNGSGYSAHFHDTGTSNRIQLTTANTGTSSSDGAIIMIDSGSNMEILNRENTNLEFFTNNTERMKIYNDGRVDIGGSNEVQLTASSTSILYLHGAIRGANLDYAYGQRIILDDDDIGTTSSDRERGSIYCQFNGNATGGDTSNETRLWNIYSDVNCNQDYDNVYGLYCDVRTTHTTGTITAMRGMYGICQHTSSGPLTEMVGVYGLSQTTTGANGVTISDLVGVKGRVNMCAGNSTANVTDLVGVWAEIDNDNNTAQATGGKCALFYGGYSKTTGLHNPQGIRIDTDVPNYMRGGLALGNGGNFLPVDDHMLHIQDQTNAKGILLRQTGNNYNSIEGDANRTGTGSILDLRGKWNGTEVTRIRFETGTDTSNKDDGQIRFFTASAGTVTDRMHIQPNGEIAVKSNDTPTDALASLHVQNGTFRVSQANGPTTEYLQVTAHTHNTDGDRHAMRYVSSGTNYMYLNKNGQLGTLHHHYAGRTRSDANSPTNYYAHGSYGFHAYAGRTDDTTNYRTLAFMRAWEAGDTEDRNFMYYVDSTSDTTTVDYDQHQRFGIKASGMLQSREDGWFGRCESDEGSPNSVYTANNTNLMRVYATNSNAHVYCQAVAVPATNIYSFYVETGTSNADDDVQFRIRSTDGALTSDSGSIGSPGDYAECFEWLDGNPSNEDRVGISVVLIGDKIRPATSSDDPSKIIGIVSANPIVVGDAAPLKYHDRYLKDDWGRDIMEDVEMLVWNIGQFEYQPKQTDTFALQKCDECIPVSDIDAALAEGCIKQWVVDQNLRRMDQRKKVNPNFDVTKKDTYKPRLERPEWDAIGMVGKVYMRKGQPTGTNWIKLSDKTASIERWLVR